MANQTLDYPYCRVDVLEKMLNQEALICHSMGDPLETALIGYGVTKPQARGKEEYARLLNASTAYAHKQCPKKVLSLQAQNSWEKENSALKVELKYLIPHLMKFQRKVA